MSNKYYFSVTAVFKNEGHILHEWIEHYKFHGTDHIYLINDESTDNYMEILQSYIDDGYVTLIQNKIPKSVGAFRQTKIYHEYIPNFLTESTWMAILDLDEFLWSPDSIDIKTILPKYIQYGNVAVNWNMFGSSGLLRQPEYVVENFTKCMDKDSYKLWGFYGPKIIINTQYFGGLFGIHHQNTTRGEIRANDLILNHYMLQSLEFYLNIKVQRGDADNYLTRDINMYKTQDLLFNDNIDTRLKEQNASLYTRFINHKQSVFPIPYIELEYEYFNLAVININNTELTDHLKDTIIRTCNCQNFDVIDYSVKINGNIMYTDLDVFINSLLKRYCKVFILSNNDFTGTIHPVKYYKNQDSVYGDILSIRPYSYPFLISELCKNNYKGINTLGYVKNMENPIIYSDVLKNTNGGLYVKTSDISPVYINHKALDWLHSYHHFNVVY